MVSCSKIKNLIPVCLLVLTLVSCGKTNGVAPGTSSCGGLSVGGACWYLGASGDSCDTTCDSHGGYNTATYSYAGPGGSLANCKNLATALGLSYIGADDSGCDTPFYMGCFYDNLRSDPAIQLYRCKDNTNSSDGQPGFSRICACNE